MSRSPFLSNLVHFDFFGGWRQQSVGQHHLLTLFSFNRDDFLSSIRNCSQIIADSLIKQLRVTKHVYWWRETILKTAATINRHKMSPGRWKVIYIVAAISNIVLKLQYRFLFTQTIMIFWKFLIIIVVSTPIPVNSC